MDEIERRATYEAIQSHHRNEWLKQVGLKPLESKPLPQLIAERREELPVQEPAPEAPQDYNLPINQAAPADASFVFDSYSRTDEESTAPFEVTDQAAPGDFPSLEPQSPPPVAEAAQPPAAPTTPPPSVEKVAKSDSVSPTPQPAPEAKKTEAKPNSYVVRPNRPQLKAPPTQEDRDNRQRIALDRKAIAEEARQAMMQRHSGARMPGNGFDARGFGGTLPNINIGADPENVGEMHSAMADAGAMNAAVVAQALTNLTNALNAATRRIRALEIMADDGAS